MYPHIVIAGRDLSTYWLVFVLGIFLMLGYNIYRSAKHGKKTTETLIMTVFLILTSLVGAKILYYMENISVLFEKGIALNGVSFFGAVFLTPLGVLAVSQIKGEQWKTEMDFYTPSLILMLAVLRIGCFVSGCCGGKAVTLAGYYISHFPTQLTECVGDLLILGGLLLYERFWTKKGRLYPFFLVYYGILRFVLEFARDTAKDWMGMSHGQWFSMIAIAVGGYLLYSFGKKERKEGYRSRDRKNSRKRKNSKKRG